jgi:hypothetical protein
MRHALYAILMIALLTMGISVARANALPSVQLRLSGSEALETQAISPLGGRVDFRTVGAAECQECECSSGVCECQFATYTNCGVPTCAESSEVGTYPSCHIPTCTESSEVGTYPNCHIPTCAESSQVGTYPSCHIPTCTESSEVGTYPSCISSSPVDSDHDGIPDSSDECPFEPGLAPTGCPPSKTAPVANCDIYWTTPGHELIVPSAAGLLHNDTDPNGSALTAHVVSLSFGVSTHPYSLSVASGALTFSPGSSRRSSRALIQYLDIDSNGQRSNTTTAEILVQVNRPAASVLSRCPSSGYASQSGHFSGGPTAGSHQLMHDSSSKCYNVETGVTTVRPAVAEAFSKKYQQNAPIHPPLPEETFGELGFTANVCFNHAGQVVHYLGATVATGGGVPFIEESGWAPDPVAVVRKLSNHQIDLYLHGVAHIVGKTPEETVCVLVNDLPEACDNEFVELVAGFVKLIPLAKISEHLMLTADGTCTKIVTTGTPGPGLEYGEFHVAPVAPGVRVKCANFLQSAPIT